MSDLHLDSLADLQRANAELTAARRAALNVMEDAIHARNALRESERRLASDLAAATALQAISSRLIVEADPAALYAQLLDAATELLHADAASIQHFEPDGSLRLLAYKGFHPESAAFWVRVDVASGSTCGQALRANRRVVVPDIEADPEMAGTRDREEYRRSALRAVQTTPLVSRAGRLLGSISTHWRRAHVPGEHELRLFDALARQAADLIERARAEAALADELATMTRLHELSDRLLSITDLPTALGEVLDAVIDLFEADRGTVQVHDPEADVLRYAAARGFDLAALAAIPPIDRDFHSTCAVAIRTGRRVVAADLAADPVWADHAPTAAALGYGAAVSTPMKTRRDDLQGVITVHFRGPHAPTDRELRWADLYARLGAHLIERGRADAALRASEERLRAVATNLPNGAAFVVGPDLRYQLAAGEALGPAGLKPADLEGRSVAEVMPPPLAAEYTANYRRALAGEPFRIEHAAHDRQYVTHGVPLRDAAGAVTAVLAVSYDITDRKVAEAALQAARDELEDRVRERTAALIAAEAGRRELLGRLVTGQEEERRRIARELHDSLGQYLTALGLGLAAARDLSARPEVRDRLDRLAELTTETGREVHRLAIELRPTALDDLGLRTSLQHLVEAWSARAGVPIEFSSRGLDGERFPWQVSTAVYRVVQEALTNVARHARAARVSVLVERDDGSLRAVVEDDGVGFDPDQAPPPRSGGGLGLLGMRERIALAGGTFQIESAPGAGTSVFVRVPVPPPPKDRHE